MTYTIVGVIGHIDHGKTSLVAALTGVDTDTHPEEKRRGITIDLGFASYRDGENQFAFIDAPGHQKYIGNLLAGVSAVDVGLLVVACDQGIEAQTLEHASILQSLGVEDLIVAMSRVDLVDDSVQNELSEELDLFLAEYGFTEVPKVAVSTVTNEGLDDLRKLLSAHARSGIRPSETAFRMPIDRVFTKEGRGCVVAGTPWSGRVAVGDRLQLARNGQQVRVRGLEVHGDDVEESQAGFRTAMNLAGTSSIEIERGDELIAAGSLSITSRIVASIKMFDDASDLRCPATIQMHTATSCCEARVLGIKRLGASEQAVVVVDLDPAILASFHQKCLFRRPYPVGSFAGGRVLASVDEENRRTRPLIELGTAIKDGDASDRIAAWTNFRGELQVSPDWAETHLGIPRDAMEQVVQNCIDRKQVLEFGGRLVSALTLDRTERFLRKLLTQQAESGDDAWSDEESLIKKAEPVASPTVVRHLIDRMLNSKDIVRVNRMVAIASEQTVLSKKQRARMDQVLGIYRGSRSPPTLKELAKSLDISVDAATSLVRFSTQQRILLDLGNGFYIANESWLQLLRELRVMFDGQPQLSVAQIRDGWKLTRKHAIPMLEYCDRQSITLRHQDLREAGPELARALASDQDATLPTEESLEADQTQLNVSQSDGTVKDTTIE